MREGTSSYEQQGEREHEGFAGRLKPTSFDAGNVRLWQIEGEPWKLARESRAADGQTLDDLETAQREGEAMFARLRDEYGLRVVSTETRRERNKEGEEAVFTVVEKIDGENVAKAESLPEGAKGELEETYRSLVRHYADAWRQKRKFWSDCRSDQFVYGNRVGEDAKHFVIVDVDPKFANEGDNAFDTIEAALGSLAHDLIENEKKFASRPRFSQARAELLSLIDEMLVERPEEKLISEARSWLMAK